MTLTDVAITCGSTFVGVLIALFATPWILQAVGKFERTIDPNCTPLITPEHKTQALDDLRERREREARNAKFIQDSIEMRVVGWAECRCSYEYEMQVLFGADVVHVRGNAQGWFYAKTGREISPFPKYPSVCRATRFTQLNRKMLWLKKDGKHTEIPALNSYVPAAVEEKPIECEGCAHEHASD